MFVYVCLARSSSAGKVKAITYTASPSCSPSSASANKLCVEIEQLSSKVATLESDALALHSDALAKDALIAELQGKLLVFDL